ncbi:hypothetical protein PISMIDRAFT_672472 [Pisolithus microcarpus 441]|uniref:Uncharacterized protein n=1 Tax=Pisolithus microcarpus 441 TaxID=765257 RepID=A0A0D0AAS6_9AGAM|nr:hypothetical protein PISMIDRAFT_672472 [Pisolithus microcarpus 441]
MFELEGDETKRLDEETQHLRVTDEQMLISMQSRVGRNLRITESRRTAEVEPCSGDDGDGISHKGSVDSGG